MELAPFLCRVLKDDQKETTTIFGVSKLRKEIRQKDCSGLPKGSLCGKQVTFSD